MKQKELNKRLKALKDEDKKTIHKMMAYLDVYSLTKQERMAFQLEMIEKSERLEVWDKLDEVIDLKETCDTYLHKLNKDQLSLSRILGLDEGLSFAWLLGIASMIVEIIRFRQEETFALEGLSIKLWFVVYVGFFYLYSAITRFAGHRNAFRSESARFFSSVLVFIIGISILVLEKPLREVVVRIPWWSVAGFFAILTFLSIKRFIDQKEKVDSF
jgi:hypothetical protein